MTLSVSARRRVGATALDLPVFGFGSAHLGELYGKVDEAASCATLAFWTDLKTVGLIDPRSRFCWANRTNR